ncbi:Protease inhibitor seed storage lipid transfer protein [Musa troglodytarum]|uniref:Protease inhibitor seed storage lipid transfer protein n=1 Tax=Musa troglodytarum TaxID=320322 RepID=A0A9E7HX56_9LILI|nr:Protease inhibitor seed storage lipid transfer protein [Musa troglodytarum]
MLQGGQESRPFMCLQENYCFSPEEDRREEACARGQLLRETASPWYSMWK